MNRKALLTAINHCRTKDVPRLLGRLHKNSDGGGNDDSKLDALQSQIQTSLSEVQKRLDACPRLDYPAELPVVHRREEIVKAIRENQVLVLCGETGSGKTTQLPKLCLEAGQGMRGLIGHTQPRRLAARNVAQRIAEELHSELGGAVGYQVRFNEQVSDGSYIKVMTDGILLAETRDDRYLNKYDTIIIDEAHERSLNIDFLMGYLAQLLAKRKDLKVIITSATIDPQRFAAFFEKALQAKVPMITAEGRSFPVETRYRYNEEATTPQAIETAIKELWEREPGDVLVFLPGERDIRETANHLERASLKNAEILPLYARLSSAQQQRIFTTGGRRRVVLATNVAETSITVPGIRHVVDTGVARISRYSHRSKVQRLPIEPVSQASANQRQGRCGRTSPGICVRLYEEADFIARPEFTEPEIKRTNLANVLLQMHDLRLGDIDAFPFLDAPDSRFVRDGSKLLEQLGAINKKGLTRVGKQMAQLPLDPRLGRVLVAAERSQCLHDALILVAGLSIQDPRERPQEKQQAADEAHSAYSDERSDFMSWIKLWQGTREQRKALSSNQYQKWCKQNFLSPLRLHEWQDVHSQLLQQCRSLRWQVEPRSSAEIPYERLHKALLHGLLDRIGLKEEAEPVKKLAMQKGAKGPRRKPPVTYQGARNTQFSMFPGSALQKKKPQWLMAWEIVETGRVYARTVATVEPGWLEQIGKDQLKHSYSDPHWSQRQGEVMAHEQITLFGILLAANRRARYAPINPAEARTIFVRQALVDGLYREHIGRGQWKQPAFLLANQQLRDEVEQIEAKARRRDVMIDESALEDFYEQRIPEDVVDAQSFRKWYGRAEVENPQLLMFSRELLIRDGADLVAGEQFPEHIDCGAVRLTLRYAFEPGREKDGITVDVPAQLLNQLDRRRLDWLVPGLIEEKITAMIRALPKATRRNFVPAPDFARAAIGRLTYGQGDLHDELAKALRAMGGATIEGDDFRAQTLEPHLNFRFQTLGDKNKVLGAGRDLGDVKQAHSEAAAVAFKKATGGAGKHPIEKTGLSDWSFGDLPPVLRLERAGVTTQAWPAVEDRGKDVAIRLLDNESSALGIHRQGVRRLAFLKVAKTLKYVVKECNGADRIETRLCAAKQPNVWQQSTIAQHYAQQAQRWPGLHEELCEVLVDEVIVAPAFEKAAVYRSADFGLMVYEHEPDLVSRATALWAQLSDAAKTLQRVRLRMEQLGLRAMQAVPDIQLQIQAMFFPGFLAAWGLDAVEQYPRYLKALEARLEKIDSNPQRDVGWQNQIAPLYKQLFEKIEQQPEFINRAGVREYRWLLEEYRISLFAQPQKPRDIVSLKRLNTLWAELKKA